MTFHFLPAGQRQTIGGIARSVSTDNPGQMGEQRDHRQDVERVVAEDGLQRRGAPEAQVVEVKRGNQPAGYVVLALEAEERRLEMGQAAGGQAPSVQPARRIEQVEVRQLGGRPQAVEGKARLQERQVETAAVEGDHGCRGRKGLERRRQHGLFAGRPGEKKLPHKEGIALEAAEADEERKRARAAGQAGGFDVDEEGAGDIFAL